MPASDYNALQVAQIDIDGQLVPMADTIEAPKPPAPVQDKLFESAPQMRGQINLETDEE